jgi:hypothetical protein
MAKLRNGPSKLMTVILVPWGSVQQFHELKNALCFLCQVALRDCGVHPVTGPINTFSRTPMV